MRNPKLAHILVLPVLETDVSELSNELSASSHLLSVSFEFNNSLKES